MKVRELMTEETCTCLPTESLQEAAQRMWTYDIGALPVVDERGHVAGVITDRDVAMAAFLSGQRLRDRLVLQAMSAEAYTCRPDDSAKDAEEQMARHQVRRLPVVDEAGKLVGMLSINDLARAAAHGRRKDAAGLVQALGAICHPRTPAIPAETAEDGAEGEELTRTVDALKQRRDELRVQMHLAKAEAKDEWEKAEANWHKLQSKMGVLRERTARSAQDVGLAARQLAAEIGEGYQRIRAGM